MNINELWTLFTAAGKNAAIIQSGDSAVLAALDLEGRLYFAHAGKVVSRVNPEAITGQSGRAGYLNPGGDGLWPAPEGTCFGYEYPTGAWRVPAGLVTARFRLRSYADSAMTLSAEIDLINNQGLGIPTVFTREVSVSCEAGKTVITQNDRIEYIGSRTLKAGEFLLAPWSLAQFAVTEESRAAFELPSGSVIRDLYSPSAANRTAHGNRVELQPDKRKRIQLALDEDVKAVELTLPEAHCHIRRVAGPLMVEQHYIDIADAPPDTPPAARGVRCSIYSDPSGFMELEACGGCAFPLQPGTVLNLNMVTTIATI